MAQSNWRHNRRARGHPALSVIVRSPVGPVQVLPPGLINLLQLKVGGFSPDALRQDIQPTIDMEAWWLRATKRNLPGTWALDSAAGVYNALRIPEMGGVQLQVPARQWWYVHRCTFMAVSAAAATATVAFGIGEPGGTRGPANNVSEFAIGDALASATAGVLYPFTVRDIWVPPGSYMGLFVGTVAVGGTLTTYLSGLSYTPLDL